MVLLVWVAGDACAQPDEPVDFARQVLPILSNKCFACHGPDSGESGLPRLDSREGATRDLGGYRAIDPAALSRSRVIARIHDADDPMPPADSGKTLTSEERRLLTRWVESGGEYSSHWAFVKPVKRIPPAGAGRENPIDAFLGDDHDRRGISFAEEADRRTLARRVALTMTGLPPDLDVLANYLGDREPGAYERLVEVLLADPAYGEHQARYWLDAVRYGDTHGLHLDNRRGIYPYRDWVVRAFNDNLPLDDFITWQVAGDLLPGPTLAQQVATGFIRMNPTTAEGGAIPAEFQAKNNFDRTETFATVMLGMTLTCARCHTHKYDPITQTEYYRLLAFFNSTAESPMDGNRYDYAPVIGAPTDQAGWDEWAGLESAVAQVADVEASAATLEYATAAAAWRSADWSVSPVVDARSAAPAAGEFTASKGLPGVKRGLQVGEGKAVWITATLTARVDQTLQLIVGGGGGTEAWIDGRSLSLDTGVMGDPRVANFVAPLRKRPGRLLIKVVGARRKIPLRVELRTPWSAVTAGEAWADLDPERRLRMIADPLGAFAGTSRQVKAERLAEKMASARGRFTTTLVARDLAKPRVTRLLVRGEYDLPSGEPLTPETPEILGLLPEGVPHNRLGLAKWLTSRNNPLVARVFINRVWQRVFGAGLVRTPEDFGRQGEQPTHRELLDWLAVELQDSGWNMKHMVRLMVTSRTFRQRSVWRRDIDDPENRRLARGPRYRLDAEVVRDIGLWAGGLLDPHMGGPGVKPHQPPGLWSALAHPASNTKKYVPDEGRKPYRRSLYMYWKRTSPHPMMILFDAPSREASCVVRSRTNTPLQSLALLNEHQRVEMARALAQRLVLERKDDASRFALLFELLASRGPTDRESRAVAGLLGRMRQRYGDAAEEAVRLLDRPGFAKRDPSIEAAELAAWSQVVITVLASDVAIMLH